MDSSLRPQARPMTELPYSDIEKIEKIVWAEARGESLEGRDAVRGVILNRLASDRFPDTVDEILNAPSALKRRTASLAGVIETPKFEAKPRIVSDWPGSSSPCIIITLSAL